MRIRSIAKKKVSDFLLGEAGQVARRSTFTVAALASASGLAAFLVATPPAQAGDWCAGEWCCGWDKYCCDIDDPNDDRQRGFRCVEGDDEGESCSYMGPC